VELIPIGCLLHSCTCRSHPCSSSRALEKLVSVAKSRRATACTEKNDESSRSHGVAVLTVGQPGSAQEPAGGEHHFAPMDGVLYVIDLAGSERSSDSKEHSKERMAETKQINLSLMALKDCIRARTIASSATPGAGAAAASHIPYRRSKLTMLLKDVFDIGCSRLCATVVIAAVSPLGRDLAHSANTLKYAAPLRVAAGKVQGAEERDPRDPALWTHDQMCGWLSRVCADDGVGSENEKLSCLPDNIQAENSYSTSTASIDPTSILTGQMSGVQFCMMPEPELFRRIQAQIAAPHGAMVAKRVSSALWTLIMDSKTRKRRPDGSIISEAEENKERNAREDAQKARYEMWGERERLMKVAS